MVMYVWKGDEKNPTRIVASVPARNLTEAEWGEHKLEGTRGAYLWDRDENYVEPPPDAPAVPDEASQT